MIFRKLAAIMLMIGGWSGATGATDIHLNFDDGVISRFDPPKLDGSSHERVALQTNSFCAGIGAGRALDLSSRAPARIPLQLTATPDYGDSFSVVFYVKTLPGAPQGTAIAGNCRYDDGESAGWLLYAQENGAWAVRLSDGKNSYTYMPTARQAINDGKFHQLAFCVDRRNGCVRFYRDGVCRAIYNTPGLGDLSSGNQTVVGGSADQDYYGQEYAFNGMLDEVRLSRGTLDDETVRRQFNEFFPDRAVSVPENRTGRLRIFEWNIWSAGRNFGRKVGIERTLDVILNADPDVVALIETYGRGEEIADALGFQFYLISNNLSIHSRYPIEQIVKVFDPSFSGGAVIRLNERQQIAVFDIWLNYLPDYWSSISKGEKTDAEMTQDEEETRHAEIKRILAGIEPFLNQADQIPVVMLGDFNNGSHLDWTAAAAAQHQGHVIAWPVSRTMQEAGLTDSYRLLNPNVHVSPGMTWSPWFVSGDYNVDRWSLSDRIDYIYFKGKALRPLHSRVVDYHPVMFPSDHAALLTDFAWLD